MLTRENIVLFGIVGVLAAYGYWQQRKVVKLSEVTQNEETLTWTDYRGHEYSVVIRRKVHGNGQETPTTAVR